MQFRDFSQIANYTQKILEIASKISPIPIAKFGCLQFFLKRAYFFLAKVRVTLLSRPFMTSKLKIEN